MNLLVALMLSVAAIGSSDGAIRYYSTLEREAAYYSGPGTRGVWWGRAAEALGLAGRPVHESELKNLLRGLSPDGSKALVQLQRGHQPGWDVTISSTKEPGILAALGPEHHATRVLSVFREAATDALSFLQDNLYTRRGKGGKHLERCGLLVCRVTHWENRDGGIALHEHNLCLNAVLRKDGTFGTLRGRDLYGPLKMAAGALFRASYARRLLELGLELTPGKHAFVIPAVPRGLCDAFSTRRKAIEAELVRTGSSGARAAEKAALRTRRPKVQVPFEERRRQWRDTARTHGLGDRELENLFGREARARPVESKEMRAALEEAANRLAHEKSSFTKHDLFYKAACTLEHRGLDSAGLLRGVEGFLADRSAILPAPSRRAGEDRFSTPWLLAAERSLLSIAEASRSERRHILRARSVEKNAERNPSLSQEQLEALRRATLAPGSIQCIRGLPGTGKTTLLKAVREAHEAEGVRVVGAALAARAARELEKEAGIQSDTVARMLRRLSPTAGKILRHHMRQLVRAAAGKPTWKLDRMALDKKTLLVIDEASLVGTIQLKQLLEGAARARAKVLLIGDNRQLQSVEAGGGFAGLCRALGAMEMSGIVRQRHAWMRDAVQAIALGDVHGALARYATTGRVHVEGTVDRAVARLIADWSTKRTLNLKDTLILAGTKADSARLNSAAQAHRYQAGALGAGIRVGGTKLHEGDRVLFTSNHGGLKVANGDLGTLERVHALLPNPWARVTVRLDRCDDHGKPIRVSFTPNQFKALELGYSVTTHRAQGQSVEKAFILGGGTMQDRELGLVMLSRHREDARLYLSELDAGPDLSILAQRMARTRQKEMALAPTIVRSLKEIERGV